MYYNIDQTTTIFKAEEQCRLRVSSLMPGSFWGDSFWTYILVSVEKDKNQAKLLITSITTIKVFVIVQDLAYLDSTDWFNLRYLVKK